MNASKVTNIIGWVLTVLLGLLFMVSSLGKLTGAATPMFDQWGYPAWFAMTIGVFELAGGIGLLIPKLARYAILGLTGIMIGAAYTHLANGEGLQVLRPLIFLAALWAVWVLRRFSFSFSG